MRRKPIHAARGIEKQQTCPCDISSNKHRTTPAAINPHSRQETAEQEWRGTSRGEETHLPRRGIQEQDCHQRQRQRGDLRANQRGRVRGPQPVEIRVPR